ncbi:LacI family DNA-binding transcriptional regulator [Vallitalea guaymasensis]|uniref:LacI family DNA-binding transcriptional regulator n=1 Tax=Vallitalea guaymasensis TaxID=1185412 RepID=UPI000DE4DE8B|nr:LacI family DNA-binding transcriptional regulator [Vallitalea guaymasensis]
MNTIKDVAKKAGVSITTVSRVLNNNNYISDMTRKKVLDAMKELDYYPHQIARALSKKQTFIIGVILPDSSNPFFAQLLKNIEQVAQCKNYKVLLCNSLNDKEKELSYIKMLKENRVDGIIMGSHVLNMEAYKNITEPIIAFERYINNSIPYVTSDNYTGGQLATNHLIERGCKNLLHISGPLDLSIDANRRADAFKLTCIDNEIDYYIVEYQDLNLNFEYFYKFIETNIDKYLDKIDGVFCSNDILAYALYVYCKNKNINVPDTLKIVGYDNSQITQMLKTPRLTTIAQPIDLIGKILCENLIRLIEKKGDAYNQQLSVTFIKGETT